MNTINQQSIHELIQRVKENEDIAHKFFEVEMSVLSTLHFKEFFEELLNKIMEKFRVSYVWISMISHSKATELVQSLASSETLKKHLNVIEKTDFYRIVGIKAKPILANDTLFTYKPLLPKEQLYIFNSIAIIPITLDGVFVGSLNFADISKERFSPGIDTSLLEQLGVVVSICLSNVAAHEELRSLAFKDPLTGLLNRRAMERALKRELGRSRRYNTPLSIVFIDLDGFKQVNDCFGHDKGDELLQFVASTLMDMSRESDIISRFAGDEFVMILPETERDAAQKLLERIQKHFLSNPVNINKEAIKVRFSFGVSSTRDNPSADASVLLKEADGLLYKDKAEKK